MTAVHCDCQRGGPRRVRCRGLRPGQQRVTTQWSELECRNFMSLPDAHSLCGTLPERAWASTIISPISGTQPSTLNSQQDWARASAQGHLGSRQNRTMQKDDGQTAGKSKFNSPTPSISLKQRNDVETYVRCKFNSST